MKETTKICRLCLSQEGVFLDLFGSESQSISYKEDVDRCLSCEVKKGDGLSSKICVKCVGLISDCRPFVDKFVQFVSDKKNTYSEDNCYYCHSANNYLFSIPEASVVKTKDCLNIEVLPTVKICHRCQFLLDSLHELKTKACAALKQFYSDSLSPKKKKVVKDSDSVDDLVHSLKNKFKMNKLDEELSEEGEELQVRLLDVCKAVGKDFFSKGTVSVKGFLNALNSSGKNHTHSSQNSSSKGSGSSSSRKKAGPLSRKRRESNTSPTKKNTKDSKVSKSPEKKKKHENSDKHAVSPDAQSSSLLDKSDGSKSPKKPKESEKPVKTPRGPSSQSIVKGVSKIGQEKDSPIPSSKRPEELARLQLEALERSRKESKKRIASSPAELDDGRPVKKKSNLKLNSTAQISDAAKESSSSDATPDSVATPELSKSSAKDDKENKGPKRRRGANARADFSKYFDQEDVDDPGSGRKRKHTLTSDDEDMQSPKIRGRKKKQHASDSDEGSCLSETPDSSVRKGPVVSGQPEFLRELDELLKFTPTNSFKPFICSVCHEGYVSTVKGKLHKLVVHDPHSNIVLQLKRCDEKSEMSGFPSPVRLEKSDVKEKQETISENVDSDSDFEQSNKSINRPSNEAFDDLFNKTPMDSNASETKQLIDSTSENSSLEQPESTNSSMEIEDKDGTEKGGEKTDCGRKAIEPTEKVEESGKEDDFNASHVQSSESISDGRSEDMDITESEVSQNSSINEETSHTSPGVETEDDQDEKLIPPPAAVDSCDASPSHGEGDHVEEKSETKEMESGAGSTESRKDEENTERGGDTQKDGEEENNTGGDESSNKTNCNNVNEASSNETEKEEEDKVRTEEDKSSEKMDCNNVNEDRSEETVGDEKDQGNTEGLEFSEKTNCINVDEDSSKKPDGDGEGGGNLEGKESSEKDNCNSVNEDSCKKTEGNSVDHDDNNIIEGLESVSSDEMDYDEISPNAMVISKQHVDEENDFLTN